MNQDGTEDPLSEAQAALPSSDVATSRRLGDSAFGQKVSEHSFSAVQQARQALGLVQRERLLDSHLNQLSQIRDLIAPLSVARRYLSPDRSAILPLTAMETLGTTLSQSATAQAASWGATHVGAALSASFRDATTHAVESVVEAARLASAKLYVGDSLTAAMDMLAQRLPKVSDIETFLEQLPSRVRANLLAMAEAGWYLDPEMPMSDLSYFRAALETDAEAANQELADYFSEAVPRIEADLLRRHQNRQRLIACAFRMHATGEYAAAIPLLLSQTDGICLDRTGDQLFSNGGLQRHARTLDPEELESAYLAPLLRATPLTHSARDRASRPASLNRHAVLHGESIDYDSQMHSLRAISLINFVSHVLIDPNDEIQ